MEGGQPEAGDKVLAKALALLRESGFTAAAAKLEKEFDSSADDGSTAPAANAHTHILSESEDVARCVVLIAVVIWRWFLRACTKPGAHTMKKDTTRVLSVPSFPSLHFLRFERAVALFTVLYPLTQLLLSRPHLFQPHSTPHRKQQIHACVIQLLTVTMSVQCALNGVQCIHVCGLIPELAQSVRTCFQHGASSYHKAFTCFFTYVLVWKAPLCH